MRKWKQYTKILLAVFLICSLSGQVYASSIDDAKQQKEDAEGKRDEAQEILDSLESTKSDMEVYVTELDAQLTSIQTQILDLTNQQETLNAEIAAKQVELETAKAQEQQQYADMCTRIKFMYENGQASYLDAFLNSESMADILNQTEYASKISEYDYNLLSNLITTRETIANAEQRLEIDLQAVQDLQAEVEAQQATVETLVAAKTDEIAQYEETIDGQQQLVDQYERDVAAAESTIAQIEEAARQQAAANGGQQTQYTGGAFVWPVPASTRITSYFGYRTPDGGVVNANHNGLDIGAPSGTPVVAAASGKVVIARASSSAGNWITIDHGGGVYTVYMHASALAVSEGQYVNAGDTIMYVGSTGWSTGPHLHFGVRVNGVYVDPLGYLR